jgi:hypothetical protein
MLHLTTIATKLVCKVHIVSKIFCLYPTWVDFSFFCNTCEVYATITITSPMLKSLPGLPVSAILHKLSS